MDEKYILALYDNLGGKQRFGEFNEFKDLISSNADYRKEFHSQIGQETLGDFSEFDNFVKKKDGQSSQTGSMVGEKTSTSQSQSPSQSTSQEGNQSIPQIGNQQAEGKQAVSSEDPISLLANLKKKQKEYSEAMKNEQAQNAQSIQKEIDLINSKLKSSEVDNETKKSLDNELSDFPWESNITKKKVEISPKTGLSPTEQYPLTKILSEERQKDYPTYLNHLAQYKIGDLIEKNTEDKKGEVNDFLYTWRNTGSNIKSGVEGLNQLESGVNDRINNVTKHIGIDNLGVLKDDTKKAIGIINDIASSDVYNSFNNDDVKKYLQSKLEGNDISLKYKSDSDAITYGVNDNGEVNYPLYSSQNDLDNYDLNSIQSKLDLSNPIVKAAFQKYSRRVGLDDALGKTQVPDENNNPVVTYNNGHSWTKDDFENAAIKYSATQDPLIGQQIEAMQGNIPESMRGKLVLEFLNNPDVKDLVKTNPELAQIYTQENNGFRFNYPKANEVKIATIISQGLEDMGETNWLVNVPTQEQVDNVVNKLKLSGKLSDADVQDYKDKIRGNIGLVQSFLRGVGRTVAPAFVEKAKIETGGLLESTQNAYAEGVKTMAKSIEDIQMLPETIMGATKNADANRLYNNLSDKYSNIIVDYKGAHELSSRTGNLLGMTVPIIFGGEVLALAKTPAAIAELAAPILAFEGHNRDLSLEYFPGDTQKQALYTLGTTGIDAFLGKLLPTEAIAKNFLRTSKDETRSIINEFVDGKITQSEALAKFKNITSTTMNFLGKNAKTTAALQSFELFHNFADKIFGSGNKDASNMQLVYDAVLGAKTTFLTTSALTYLEMGGTGSSRANHKVLWEVANDPAKYEQIIRDRTDLSESDKSEMLSNLATASTIVKDLNDLNTSLTEEQKQKYLASGLKKDIYMRKAQDVSDVNISQKYVEKANEYNNIQKEILDNKNKADELNNYNVSDETKIKQQENDSKNTTGISSGIRGGETTKQTESKQAGSGEETGTGGVLQTPVTTGGGEAGVQEKVTAEEKIYEYNGKQYKVKGNEVTTLEDNLVPTNLVDKILTRGKEIEPTKQKENEPIQPTGKKVSGTVQPTTEVPKGQEAEAGVQPGAKPVSGGGAEATTPVLKEGEPKVEKKKTKAQEVGEGLLSHLGIPVEQKESKKYTSDNVDNVDTEGFSDKQKEAVNNVKNVVKSVSKLVKKSTGSDLSITIHTSPTEYAKAVEDAGGTKQDSSTKGFYLSSDGSIHINMSKATKDTIPHEAFHPVLDYLENNNPEIINKFHTQLEKLAGTENIIQNAKKSYEGEVTQKKEAITDFVAKVASGEFELTKTNFEKVRDYVVNMLNQLGINVGNRIENIKDLKQLAQLVSEKFATGEEIKIKETGLQGENIENPLIQKSGNIFFSKTKYHNSGIEKVPALDTEKYKEDIKSGRVSVVDPKKSLENKIFAINQPDDLFVGDININGKKIANLGGGVIFAADRGNKGIAWASVTEGSAKTFVDNANRSFEKNNGEGVIVFGKGSDIKHATSLDAKLGLVKTLLSYADGKEGFDGLVNAIKEVYSIGNAKKASTIIELFDNYLKSGRMADGQTMNEAKTSYDNFRASLIKNANPIVTQMMRDMGFDSPEYFDATQLKKGVYKATGKGIDVLFADLFQEDFLKKVPTGSAYGAIKFNSKLTYAKESGHPSYPVIIKTIDGSPVKLELFDKTFMLYGKNQAVLGREPKPGQEVTGGLGQVTTTLPNFTLNKEYDFNSEGSTDLNNKLNEYSAINPKKPQFSKEDKKIEWEESKIGRGDRAITERNENVKNAAEDLYQGKIDLDEYNAIVDKNSPTKLVTDFIEPAKEEDIRTAVGAKSEGKVNLDFPEGKKVGVRLDIPAYINKNIWAITVHEPGVNGSPLSYNNVARIRNVEFITNPAIAIDIARHKELSSGGRMGKAPIARMMGEWIPIEGDTGEAKGKSAMKMVEEIKDSPEWVQIGMNPFRFSHFYDRATGTPIVKAEEIIQIGGLVYGKNVETTSKNDPRFTVKDKNGNPIIGKGGKPIQFSKEEKVEGTLDGKPTTFIKHPEDLEVVNGFYSPIEKRLLETKADKLSANKWKEIVGKGDEAKFTGVSDWLESIPPTQQVSKSEIQNWMKDNRIEISEVVKSDKDMDVWEKLQKNKELPKYEKYQLPGEKSNYKEVLVTLPGRNKLTELSDELVKEGFVYTPSGEIFPKTKAGLADVNNYPNGISISELPQKAKLLAEKIKKNKDIQEFKYSHYDEPNILAHIRMNTRVDAEGNKVLHIEEFQSDWGQKGRKEGFVNESDIKRYKELNNKILDGIKKLRNEGKLDKNDMPANFDDLLTKKESEELDKLSKIVSDKKFDVPQAPFVTKTADWTKLAWKVALKEAVKEGADKITWTTGEQQNDRYDLRKQVDEVNYYKTDTGDYHITGDKNGKSVASGIYKENELEGILGKEIAKKIIDNEGEKVDKYNSVFGYDEFGQNQKYKSLRGDDLAVGGKGMKGFYGSPSEGKIGIVGEVAKALFKQVPKITELDTKTIKLSDEAEKKMAEEGWTSGEPNKDNYSTQQHSIDVTPEMKAEVEAGLPQFSKGKAQESQIKEYIDSQRKAGVSEEDIRAGIESVADKIGLDASKIDSLMAGEVKPEVPKAKETTTPSPEEDPEMTKMANAVNDAFIEGKFGEKVLDDIMSKLQDTDTKNIYEKAKAKIKSGAVTAKEIRERVITEGKGSEFDQAALMYDLADLKGKESGLMDDIVNEKDDIEKNKLSQKLLDVHVKMEENALANRLLGRSASSIFRLRQLWVNRDMDLNQMQRQYMASKGLKELTPEQTKEVTAAYNKIRETKAKLDKTKAELDKMVNENETLKIENEKLKEFEQLAKEKAKKDRAEKASEKIQKSAQRIKQAVDRLRGLRGNMNVGVDPRVAIEIGKIAAEKFYQGAVKLDVLVKDILDEVKEVFPTWTEKDVREHLFPDSKNINKFYDDTKDYKSSSKELKAKIEEHKKLQKEYANTIFEWQKGRRVDLMDNKPWSQKMLDNIYSWQRFAILSYPATFVKLAAVVGHNLLMKPMKFGLQFGLAKVASTLSKDFGGKMGVYGDPSLKALGKYYSEFIRNMSLANLKEQFSGIDTKEILYGDKFMYDEWAAGKGLLEMPGRSHGYIKSFVKNPEFVFAHEMITSQYISKMAEFGKKLENKNLTEEQRAELQKEYDNYDVTNEDVLMRINKLSLQHGKDAILMGNSKIVDGFRAVTKGSSALSTLAKTEMPIVKIPINFINRAILTKYGLFQSLITGNKWGAEENKHPSVAKLIYKGTEGLTDAQGQALSKAILYGSMGATLFALGYMNKDKVKKNEDGSIEFMGMHISKNLLHVPEFESFFSGVETAQKFKDEKKASDWIYNFIASDKDFLSKNPFLSPLEYGLIGAAVKLLTDKNMKEETAKKLVGDVAIKKIIDMTVPGFLKQPAQWLDTEEGKGMHPMGTPIERKPQGNLIERFGQSLEMAIPGLRQNVPLSPKEKIKIFTPEEIKVNKNLDKLSGIGMTFEMPSKTKIEKLTDKGTMTDDEYNEFVKKYKELAESKIDEIMKIPYVEFSYRKDINKEIPTGKVVMSGFYLAGKKVMEGNKEKDLLQSKIDDELNSIPSEILKKEGKKTPKPAWRKAKDIPNIMSNNNEEEDNIIQ